MVMMPSSFPFPFTTGRRSTLFVYMISSAFSAVISSFATIGFLVMIVVIFSSPRLETIARTSRRLTIPMIFPLSTTGHAADAVLVHQVLRVRDRGGVLHVEHVALDQFLGLLDDDHLLQLALGRHVPVDHADPADPCEGDRHRGLGHGVHRRGHERDIDADLFREPRARIGLGRFKPRCLRFKQDIVEG